MSETERIQKEIASVKRDIQFQKNYMERPNESLTPKRSGKYMYQLIKGRERLASLKNDLKKAGGEYKPDEADIRAAELLDNLLFLERLTFRIGGFCGGHHMYTVKAAYDFVEGGPFYYTFADGSEKLSTTDPILVSCLNGSTEEIKTLEDLGCYLQDIHLEEWLPEYWPDRFGVEIVDGTQWHLKVEFSNGYSAWESFGSNSYPYTFDDFQELFGLQFSDENVEF